MCRFFDLGEEPVFVYTVLCKSNANRIRRISRFVLIIFCWYISKILHWLPSHSGDEFVNFSKIFCRDFILAKVCLNNFALRSRPNVKLHMTWTKLQFESIQTGKTQALGPTLNLTWVHLTEFGLTNTFCPSASDGENVLVDLTSVRWAQLSKMSNLSWT